MNLYDLVSVTGALAEEPDGLRQIVELCRECDSTQDSRAIYQTMRGLFAAINRPAEALLHEHQRLLALHEVSAVHDGGLFAALSIHVNLCLGTIRALGDTTEYVQALYQQLLHGDAVGVFLATELAYGNNVVALRTTAIYHPERRLFVLDSPDPAAFKYMPNTPPCGLPKVAVVMARLIVAGQDYGVAPFLVPFGDAEALTEGVKISRLPVKPGFGLDNAMTEFRRVELPLEALMSRDILSLTADGKVELHHQGARDRFLAAMGRVQFGKLCMASAALGMGKAALHITQRYGQQRQTFAADGGQVPLLAYTSFSQPLCGYAASLMVMSLWVRGIAERLQADEVASQAGQGALRNEVAVAKAQISWIVLEVVVDCRELCGAQGLFSVNKLAGYYATINGCITAEGDNLVIMQKAGRDMLKDPLTLADVPSQSSLAPWMLPLHQHCHTRHAWLRALLAGNDMSDYAQRWNSALEPLLDMVQSYGVLCCLQSAMHYLPVDSRVQLALELYLLDWHERLALPMLMTQAIQPVELKQGRERRQALLAEHGSALVELINEFGLEAAGLLTPISSDDYIDWYAEYHRASSL